VTETSFLKVEIVPLRTEEDRQLFGMARRVLRRMMVEIILEMRGLDKGEIDGWNNFDRADNSGANCLGRPELFEAVGGEA
jgi:hypothetical protein